MNARPLLLALFAAACLAAFSTAAAAQDAVPTDIELRAAYCMSVMNRFVDMQQKMIAEADAAVKSAATPEQQQQANKMSAESREDVRKSEAARQRLRTYYLARMGAVDSVALTAALQRGDADFREATAMMDRCPNKCGGPPDDKWRACVSSCLDNDLLARVRACRTPTWLPF